MLYQVSRNGQMYGPYTLEDLRRYLGSGNVLAGDFCKSEEMAEWKSVGEVLGVAPTGFTQPPYAAGPVYGQAPAGGAADANAYPDPPNLSWGLVILFTFLTCGLFMVVWNIVVSAWMRRVQPNSQALLYYIGGAVLLLVNGGLGTSSGMLTAFAHGHRYYGHPFSILILLAGWIVRLVARLNMKASLEEQYNRVEPVGLTLSGVMTFFFGGVYHQYHLNRINEIKRAIRFGRTRVILR